MPLIKAMPGRYIAKDTWTELSVSLIVSVSPVVRTQGHSVLRDAGSSLEFQGPTVESFLLLC